MLSIVIPTKNEEQDLPVLLRSIQNQTLRPDAIIVADADSDDKTREIAQSFGAKIVAGGLPGVGRNKGALAVESEFILFLDADVELRNALFIEEAIKEIKKRKLDIATCDVFPISRSRVDKFFHFIYNNYVRITARMKPHAPGFCIFVRKSLHDSIKGFDETIIFCEDHDYAQRAVKKGKFGILSRKLSVPVSVRRFSRDGRLMIAIKFLLAEFHLWFLGPIRDNRFHYTFGHNRNGKK